MLIVFSSQKKVCFYILILHTCKTCIVHSQYNLAIEECRKMLILKTATSPRMLDQVYSVPVETAFKDTWLGYKHVLHVVQSEELKTQVIKHISLVYLTTGVNEDFK